MYDFWHFWDQTTLGAGDFSCAVSGFGQVLKSDPREKPNSEDVSACGRRPTKLLVTPEKKSLVPRVGPNELFVIERCPYYRGVRKERLDCITFFTFVIFRLALEATPLQYKFSWRVVYFQQGLKRAKRNDELKGKIQSKLFKLNFFYSQKIKINCTINIWMLFVTYHLLKGLCHCWIVHFFIDASCMSVLAAMKLEKLLLNGKITSILSNVANNLRQVCPSALPFVFVVAFILSFNVLGPVPRKVVKFNQRLS